MAAICPDDGDPDRPGCAGRRVRGRHLAGTIQGSDMTDQRSRDNFVDWLCRQQDHRSADSPASGQLSRILLDEMSKDRTPLPARARFCLPGCHVPTHAHAARLLVWAIDADLAMPEALPRRFADLPDWLLAQANRRIDDELWNSGSPLGSHPPARNWTNTTTAN